MNLPIESVPISYTTISGEKNFMVLEAPNGDDPFYFSVARMNIRGKFRDKNNVLRRKFEKYTVKWVYDYQSHLMDLRKLLTAVEITLSAPPDFVGTYQSYPVSFMNKEAVKNWLEGLAMAGTTISSFDTVPSGSVQLEFEIKTPLTWQEVMNFKTFQGITSVLDVPILLEENTVDQDVTFNWNAINGVDGYNLYVDSGSGFVKHNSSLIETNSYLIEGFDLGNYSAYVVAVLNETEGVQSNTVSYGAFADIDFQSASDLTIQSSSTTVASTIPADVLPGDFMVLHLMHRSALTAPAGWTLIQTTVPISAFTQYQSALYRIAQAGDESSVVTSTQGSAGRFLSHIQVFRSEGTIGVINSDSDEDTGSGLNLPEIASTAIGQMAVVSMTNVLANTGGATTEVLPPAGYTQTTLPDAIIDKRMGCAYKKLTHPETISGRFVINTTDDGRTAISIILGAS